MKNPHIHLVIGFLLLISCNQSQPTSDPLQHIKDPQAKELLHKALKAAGGLENWHNIQRMRFTKDFKLLKESGEIENAAFQSHDYQFSPQDHVSITWEKEGQQHLLESKAGEIHKSINGEKDPQANLTSLKNTVLSATFVISIPYKLLDPGVVLSYDGQNTLEEGQKVEVLKAVYNPANHDSHSTPDTWWHFYDAETYEQIGYMVQHADHYSYVKNLENTKVNGFVLPVNRESYRVDENRDILYLRATYVYDEYEVE